MNGARDFVINFGSLAPGEHEFEFEVKDSFFQRFENSLIQKGNVDILVVLEKKENILFIDFTMEGTVTVPCDRCLEDLDLEIESFNELIVKFGAEREELSDNVIVLSSKEHELDVSQYIYEYLTLLIPMRNVHDEVDGESGCDPEVLKALEKLRISEATVDPRWEALKKINLN